MKTVMCILFFAAPLCSYAAAMDGNQMLEKWQIWFKDETPPTKLPEGELLDMGYCAGYFEGVLDSYAMQFAVDKKEHIQGRRQYCRPEEVTNGQVMKVVKKWLDNNPEKVILPWRNRHFLGHGGRISLPIVRGK